MNFPRMLALYSIKRRPPDETRRATFSFVRTVARLSGPCGILRLTPCPREVWLPNTSSVNNRIGRLDAHPRTDQLWLREKHAPHSPFLCTVSNGFRLLLCNSRSCRG